MPPITKNVLWGLAMGFGMFVFLAAFAGVVRLFAGAERWYEHWNGITYTTLLGTYALAAFFGGVAFGLMRPLTRRRWGAALTGVTIAFIGYWIMLSTAMGDWSLHYGKIITCLFGASITGIYMGLSTWNDEYGPRSKRALRKEEENEAGKPHFEDHFGRDVEDARRARR